MPESAVETPLDAANEALLAIEGIHCSACTQLIEARLRALGGVEHVSVSLMTHRARVRFRARETELNAILAEVTRAGYRAWPIGAASAGAQAMRARRVALWRLFVAGFAMMQVMMYAFPAYIAIPGEMDADIDALLRYASLILCVPVLLFSASPLLRGAWRDLRNRRIGMDVPVALGILVTFCGSAWNTLAGGGAVFFDSLAMFVFVLLGGRYLEMLARERASAAIEELTRLQPARAERLIDFPASLRTESVDAQALAAGDLVLVRAGDAVPADGEVLRGESHCDEALLTGESRPVPKQLGAPLIGGALNLEQALCMRVTRAGGESRIAGIVRLMEQAAAEKPGLVQLADRHAGHFLWGVLLLAAVAGLYWAQSDLLKGLWVAITILVVTCPCALALAAPVALSASIGRLARRGLLVTSGRALEALSHATDFVFDKTGTLTTGRMQLLDITLLGPPGRVADRDTVLRLAARLEEGAVHPVARAICMHAAALPVLAPNAASSIAQLRETTGQGVEAQVDGVSYRIGRADFALALGGHAHAMPANPQGYTQALLADARGPLALLSFGDGIRPGAAELIDSLRRAGRRTLLLSGDDAQTAARIGGVLGLDEVHAGMTPDAKRDFIATLQARGARVAMIGDGINDAPALALADVSIAMGSGAPLSQARADMVLMAPRPTEIADALDTARRCHAIVRENLGWAALYNAVAIPLAACGWLTPWMAAIGMSASSLVVVLNSLRLTREAGQGARHPMPAPMLSQTQAA